MARHESKRGQCEGDKLRWSWQVPVGFAVSGYESYVTNAKMSTTGTIYPVQAGTLWGSLNTG